MLKKLFQSPLEVGQMAPDFLLYDQNSQSHRLNQYRGKWVLIYFYPKDQSFGCTRESCSFQDSKQDFESMNAQILGISTDNVESHAKFAKTQGLDFPLLADVEKKVSKQYGVLLPIGISNRVTFIISPDGLIADRLSWVNWFRYGPTVAKRLQELQGA